MKQLSNTVILLGATVFVITGAAKILALISMNPTLAFPNPIFPFLPNRVVMLVAATMETTVAILTVRWRAHRSLLAVALISWMASLLALYRLGLALLGYHNSCSCFGFVGAWLFPSGKEATAATLVLAAILVPGYTRLLHWWLVAGGSRSASACEQTGISLGFCANTQSRMKTNQVCGLLLLIGLIMCSPCDAQRQPVGFWAKGIASSSVFDAKGGLAAKRHSVHFSAEVAGPAWCLTIINANNQSQVFFCDGTNLVSILYDTSSHIKLIPATVDPAGPPLTGGYPDFVWLALCSSSYLESGGQPTAPWTSGRDDVRAHMYDARIVRLLKSTRLPEHIEFYFNPSLRKEALQSKLLRYEGISENELINRKIQSALETHRYHAADYDVLRVTNVYQWSFPSSFHLINYRDLSPKLASHGYTNKVRGIYEGTVEEGGALFKQLSWPALNGVAGVVDRRFKSRRQGIEFIPYFVTNQWRIDVNDPWLQQLFAAKKQTAPFVRFSIPTEVILWCLFGFLALMPVIVWSVVKIARKKQTQT